MIVIVPLALAFVLVVSSRVVARLASAAAARRRATAVATACLLTTMIGLALPVELAFAERVAWFPHGLLRSAPLVVSFVTLIAVALAPLATHPPKTMARVLLLAGTAHAALGVVHPATLLFLWGVSAAVVWLELRGSADGNRWDRMFALYHGASVVFLALGVGLLVGGEATRAFATLPVLMAVGIREAVMPGHSWFTRVVERAPMGVVVAFAAPQLGVVVQLELLEPARMLRYDDLVAALAGVTAVSAALLGVIQVHARRGLAYLVISQTGLIALGLVSHNPVGAAGALLNWQVLALATSGFAMTLAALEARRGPLLLHGPNGNFEHTPTLAASLLVFGLASVGFPLTLGFIAEDLLLQGTVSQYPALGLVLVIATAFNGVTVLRMFFYLFTGARHGLRGEHDLSPRERWVSAAVLAALLGFGVCPQPATALHLERDTGGPSRSR